MKLYSDIITGSAVYEAALRARTEHGQDIYVEDLSEKKGRKRAHSITLYCGSEHGRYAVNRPQTAWRGRDRTRAASWTAWGWLLAILFKQDPHAVMGEYDGAADFERQCLDMIEYRRRYGDNVDFLAYLNEPVPA